MQLLLYKGKYTAAKTKSVLAGKQANLLGQPLKERQAARWKSGQMAEVAEEWLELAQGVLDAARELATNKAKYTLV
jgi:hypothetical protein